MMNILAGSTENKSRVLSPRLQVAVSFSVIAIALVLFYSNSFTATWHYDDFHHIKENINIRKLSNIPVFFKDPSTFSRSPQNNMYRPLLMATHAVNYRMGLLFSGNGYAIVWYHVINFLFHLLAATAIFFTALFLFQRRVHVPEVNPSLIAAFAALLFGLHTINTETVVYISSRSSGMSAMFVFWALYLYLRGTDAEKAKALPLVFSGILYTCGLMSKEIAITLPAMLIFYELLLNREWMKDRPLRTVLTGLSLRMTPFAAGALLYLAARHLTRGENLIRILVSKGGPQAASSLAPQLATQSRVWVYYVREWLWPTSLSIDKAFSVSDHFSEPAVILSLVLLLGILTAVLLIRNRHPLVTFGTLWFFTALLPTSLFRLNIILNDHRLYLSGLGGSLVFAYVAARLLAHYRALGERRYRFFIVLCIATLLFMGLGTFKRNTVFATEEAMWRDVILKDRENAKGYNNLGIYYEASGDLDRAIRYYNRAAALRPDFPNPFINLANVYHQRKEYEKAVLHLSRAISLDRRSAISFYNLGNIYRNAGETDKAISSYQEALILNPRYIEAANNMANIYLRRGEYQEAIINYRKALDIDPTFAMAHYNLGITYEKTGDLRSSRESYAAFLRYYTTEDPEFVTRSRAKIAAIDRSLKLQ